MNANLRKNWVLSILAFVAGLLALLAGCSSGSGGNDGVWQIQLYTDASHPLNTSYDVALYDVDLFDTDAATIAALTAEGREVICYFSTAYEDWRPDKADFPLVALGSNMSGWPGEQWVDITDPTILTIMEARMDRAVAKGCTGVDPDNVNAYELDVDTTDGETTGFNLNAAQQLAFNQALAAAAHSRGLTIGLKNDLLQVDTLYSSFDFAVNEQCYFYDECDYLEPFIAAGKPVYQIEYDAAYQSAGAARNALCADSAARGHHTLVMPLNLDDSSRYSCE